MHVPVLGRPLLSEVRRAQARWRWRCLVPPRSTPLHAVSKHEYEEVCVNVYETGRHSAAARGRAHANVFRVPVSGAIFCACAWGAGCE